MSRESIPTTTTTTTTTVATPPPKVRTRARSEWRRGGEGRSKLCIVGYVSSSCSSSGGRVVVAAEAQHSKEEEDRADGDTSELRAARRRGRAWSGGVAVVCATSIATASPMVSAMGIASVASSSLAWAFAGTMAGAAALGHLVVPQLQRIKFGQV